jgi:hypothetical protein
VGNPRLNRSPQFTSTAGKSISGSTPINPPSFLLLSILAAENDLLAVMCHPGLQVWALLDTAEKPVAQTAKGGMQFRNN